MQITAVSMYPLSLQGKKESGELINVNPLDERYYLIDGKKVSKKYFSREYIILSDSENKSRGLSFCGKCGKRTNQAVFPNREHASICFDCTKDSTNKFCAACGCFEKCKPFNGYNYCARCKYTIECAKCGETFNSRHTMLVNSEGYADSTRMCNNCSKLCKICGYQTEGEFCYVHRVKTKNSSCQNMTKRAVGIEIELINKLHNYPSGWRATSDSSLSDGGVEYISSPYAGDEDMVFDLDYIENEIEKSSCYADKSCGLHVHVDTRDFTKDQAFQLYRVCKNIEGWIYSLIPPARRVSKYAEPLDFNEADDLENTIYGDYVIDKTLIKRDKYQVPRYKWANFHSMFYRGSIEFRCHHGIINAEKIYYWTVLCQKIVDYVKMCNDIPKDGIQILEKTGTKKNIIAYFRRRVEVMS